MRKTPQFAAVLDGHAIRYTMSEAWILSAADSADGTERWVKADLLDVFNNASVLTESRFTDLFGKVPELPAEAFAAAAPPILQHSDRVGPLPDDSWDSDPTQVRPIRPGPGR